MNREELRRRLVENFFDDNPLWQAVRRIRRLYDCAMGGDFCPDWARSMVRRFIEELYVPPVGFEPVIDEINKRGGNFVMRYAWFKFCVAFVLEPKTIVELGVGCGVAARAFLRACPMMNYWGIDDQSQYGDKTAWLGTVNNEVLTEHGLWARKVADTSTLLELPSGDLVHVDAQHDFEHCRHDVTMALKAAPWVLVDDTRHTFLAHATMKAFDQYRPGAFEWAYFEDTFTGDILLYRERVRE